MAEGHFFLQALLLLYGLSRKYEPGNKYVRKEPPDGKRLIYSLRDKKFIDEANAKDGDSLLFTEHSSGYGEDGQRHHPPTGLLPVLGGLRVKHEGGNEEHGRKGFCTTHNTCHLK